MAKLVQFPGATIELGKITASDEPGRANVECTMRVNNPARLFWWAVRNEYNVRWWQWPRVVAIVVKIAVLHRLGKWRWFEDD